MKGSFYGCLGWREMQSASSADFPQAIASPPSRVLGINGQSENSPTRPPKRPVPSASGGARPVGTPRGVTSFDQAGKCQKPRQPGTPLTKKMWARECPVARSSPPVSPKTPVPSALGAPFRSERYRAVGKTLTHHDTIGQGDWRPGKVSSAVAGGYWLV